MSDIKNKEILDTISDMMKDADPFQKKLFYDTLQNAYVQQSQGKKLSIDKKLYDWIDAEAKFILSKNED